MAAYGDSNTVLASVSRVIGQNSAIFAGGGEALKESVSPLSN